MVVHGTDLTWTLNETTGHLTISGTGEMDDFARDSTSAWREYKDLIKSVTIEDGVTTIGAVAFYGCYSLTSVTIGDSVTTIGNSAFNYCDSLTDVYYTGDIVGWCGISSVYARANPMSYADNLYIDGKLVEGELIIPDSVTTIGYETFAYCDRLTSVTFGENSQLTAIDEFAFYGCDSLTDVYYTGTEEQWNNIAIRSDNDALINATIHFNYVLEEN